MFKLILCQSLVRANNLDNNNNNYLLDNNKDYYKISFNQNSL